MSKHKENKTIGLLLLTLLLSLILLGVSATPYPPPPATNTPRPTPTNVPSTPVATLEPTGVGLSGNVEGNVDAVFPVLLLVVLLEGMCLLAMPLLGKVKVSKYEDVRLFYIEESIQGAVFSSIVRLLGVLLPVTWRVIKVKTY